MKRVFIAIKTEAEGELLRMISSIKSLLAAEKIKWVDTSNIHLTLAFLGETEEKRIKLLSTLLKDKCTDFHAFEFAVTGIGVFKNYSNPKVIWAGIGFTERLSELNSLIAGGLKDSGFIFEDRRFKPHITIGRIRSVADPEKLKKVLEKYSETEFQTVIVREVILFESILMQTGPLYKMLGSYQLK